MDKIYNVVKIILLDRLSVFFFKKQIYTTPVFHFKDVDIFAHFALKENNTCSFCQFKEHFTFIVMTFSKMSDLPWTEESLSNVYLA